jgi:hypothetical protein
MGPTEKRRRERPIGWHTARVRHEPVKIIDRKEITRVDPLVPGHSCGVIELEIATAGGDRIERRNDVGMGNKGRRRSRQQSPVHRPNHDAPLLPIG